MVWQVAVTNDSGSTVVAPAQDTVIGTSAVIFTKFGTISLEDSGHLEGGPHHWAIQVTSGQFKQLFWYDGQGLVNLTINSDGTFFATGQGNELSGKISGPMGRIFQLPASKRVYINGVTNAAWSQRVSLTLGEMGATYVWAGTGEENHELMSITVDTIGDPSGLIQAGVLMEHGQGPDWVPNDMSPVGTYQLLGCNLRIVTSEDGGDQDYNDSGMQIQWWELP